MVLAWSILSILAAVGMSRPAGAAQATHRIASSSTEVTLMATTQPAITQPAGRRPGEAALTATTCIVRPDDTPPSILARQTPGPPSPMAHATPVAVDMPPWLKAMLLAVGIVTGLAVLSESALAVGRSLCGRRPRLAVKKASIIRADHERLIVTYSLHDDTIYILTPPGEDPSTVLRAARLVLPEDKYQELADELGMPDSWPTERP